MAELTKNQQDDVRFIKRCHSGHGWPRWPLCPMKRYTTPSQMEGGFLRDTIPLGQKNTNNLDPNHEMFRTVYLMNPWTVWKGEFKGKWSDIPKKVYPTIEAMLEDGWQCD